MIPNLIRFISWLPTSNCQRTDDHGPILTARNLGCNASPSDNAQNYLRLTGQLAANPSIQMPSTREIAAGWDRELTSR